MTDVDSSPQQSEPPTAPQQEESAGTAGEPPHANDASEDASHGSGVAGDDGPGGTRDAPEGSDADVVLPPQTRQGPEGHQKEDGPQIQQSPAAADTNAVQESDSGQQGGEQGAPESGVSSDPAQQADGEETRMAGDGEDLMTEKEKDKEKEGGGESGGEDTDRAPAGGGGDDDGENRPPPTPTFSDDDDDDHPQDVDDVNRRQAQEALAAEEAAEADERADRTMAMATPSAGGGGAGGGALPPNAKRLTNTPLEGGVLPLKPPTAQLPPVARGQVRGQQMTSAITDALRQRTQAPTPKQLIRARRPPKYIRLATVTVSPARARQLPQGPSLYYEEPRRPRKVITWEEANNARPPLRIDMEGPGPCTYTPRVKPLNETNAPSYTFGSKCQPEKTGGSRTAWTKSWFQTPHVWHNKVDFTREPMWPSPSHYPKGSSLGPRQRTMPEAPSFTFGHKMAYSIVKPGAPKEPSPNEYRRQLADKVVLSRGPSFTHQMRREGTVLWGASELTPGPAAYSPQKPGTERPAFTIQGVRREKSHMLGPYSSL